MPERRRKSLARVSGRGDQDGGEREPFDRCRGSGGGHQFGHAGELGEQLSEGAPPTRRRSTRHPNSRLLHRRQPPCWSTVRPTLTIEHDSHLADTELRETSKVHSIEQRAGRPATGLACLLVERRHAAAGNQPEPCTPCRRTTSASTSSGTGRTPSQPDGPPRLARHGALPLIVRLTSRAVFGRHQLLPPVGTTHIRTARWSRSVKWTSRSR